MFKLKKLLLPAIIGLTIGVLVVAAHLLLRSTINGKFPPNTTISNIDVAYKTPDQAEQMLKDAADKYLASPLKISLNDKILETTPQEIGVEILSNRTVKITKEINANRMSIFDWLKFFQIAPQNTDIIVNINLATLRAKLDEEFALSTLAPLSANFYFDENYKLAISEEAPGQTLDEQKLISDLKAAAKALDPKPITLNLSDEAPQITKEILEEQFEETRETLRHEFVLIDPIYSDDWYISLIDHLDWVTFVEKEVVSFDEFPILKSEKQTAVEIDQNKLNEYIDAEISKWLDVEAEDVSIYTDEEGKVIIEGKGGDGLKIQRANLKKAIELAVMHKIKDIEIPVQKLEPKITVSKDLEELGIIERIGIGHSSYYRSPSNRVHNIKVGASQFEGLLIAPGDVFSFNTSLGRVDGTTGYRKELVIKPEGTIPEYGGGICQVSTTMYRAALFTGLPMVERNEHSYAVSYYSQVLGDGLDATIYLGGADLKFTNDTENHILIQTYTKDDYELFIIFYGTSDGRTIEMEGPYLSGYNSPGPTQYIETDKIPLGSTKQVGNAHTGFKVLWYRYIYFPDKEPIIETISTNYKATPTKVWVGI